VEAGKPCLCGEKFPWIFGVCAHVPGACSLAQNPSRDCVLQEDSLAEESRAVRELQGAETGSSRSGAKPLLCAARKCSICPFHHCRAGRLRRLQTPAVCVLTRPP
jgi:hypothetical protein